MHDFDLLNDIAIALMLAFAGGIFAKRAGLSPVVGYLLAYGLRAGDRLEIAVEGPDGRTTSSAGFDLDEDAPRATRAAGRRRPPEGWPPGIYRVEVRIRRGKRSFARGATFAVAQ